MKKNVNIRKKERKKKKEGRKEGRKRKKEKNTVPYKR